MIELGQVYRDKDKRMSSGNRHVKVVGLITRGAELVKVRCAPCRPSGWEHSTRTTKISPATLAKRFERVEVSTEF